MDNDAANDENDEAKRNEMLKEDARAQEGDEEEHVWLC